MWVIDDPGDKEPVTFRSSKVAWTSKFLNNLKIWFLFGNPLKLNFLQFLAWTILKGFVLCLYTKDHLIHRPTHDIQLNISKYFREIICKEKENKVNWGNVKGLCFALTIVNRTPPEKSKTKQNKKSSLGKKSSKQGNWKMSEEKKRLFLLSRKEESEWNKVTKPIQTNFISISIDWKMNSPTFVGKLIPFSSKNYILNFTPTHIYLFSIDKYIEFDTYKYTLTHR